MRAPGQYWWGWLLLLPVEAAFWASLFWVRWPLPLGDQELWPVFFMLGALAVVSAVLPIYAAVATRRRYQSAVAAVTAAISARAATLPHAAEPQPTPQRVLAEEPVSLFWRYSFRGRLLLGLVAGALLDAAYGFSQEIVGLLLDKRLVFGDVLTRFARHADPTSNLIVDSIPLVLLVLIALLAQPILARPFGVIAHEDGIEVYRIFGPRRRLRWDDAVHFQVVYDGDYCYYLYTPRTYITWQEFRSWRKQGLVPVGIAPHEVAARKEMLRQVVTQRTGLEPQSVVRPTSQGRR